MWFLLASGFARPTLQAAPELVGLAGAPFSSTDGAVHGEKRERGKCRPQSCLLPPVNISLQSALRTSMRSLKQHQAVESATGGWERSAPGRDGRKPRARPAHRWGRPASQAARPAGPLMDVGPLSSAHVLPSAGFSL